MSTIMEYAKIFFDKFKGLINNFALQQEPKDGKVWYLPADRAWTEEEAAKHLEGKQTVAQYVICEDGTANYGVFDIDVRPYEPLVNRIVEAGAEFNIPREIFVVEDSGGKGGHVWIFFEKPIHAAEAKRFLLAIRKKAGVACEIFPKQDRVGAKGFSNPIKLPCGIHRGTRKRCNILDENFQPLPIEKQMERLQRIPTVSVAVVLDVISQADKEKIAGRQPERQMLPVKELDELMRSFHLSLRARPCLGNLFENGVKEGDRNNATVRLASHMKSLGISEDRALAMLQNWNQLNRPVLSVDELQSIIKSAFANSYNWSCENDDFLQANCPPSRCCIPSRNPIAKIHLSAIGQAEYSGRHVECDVMIAGVSRIHHVPRMVEAHCENHRCQHKELCALYADSTLHEISTNSDKLIDMTEMSKKQVRRAVLEELPCALPPKEREHILLDFNETYAIQTMLLVPKAHEVHLDATSDQVVDELGREVRDQLAFYPQVMNSTNRYYRATGIVMPNPKNQQVVFLIHKLEPIGNDYENFKVTPEVIEEFRSLQVLNGESVSSQVNKAALDISSNIAKTYGPDHLRVLIGMLLVYHSSIRFSFDGELLQRGWLEYVLVGDTGMAKTQMIRRLMRAIGMGEMIDGPTTKRTGLTHAFITVGDEWFLKWGAYPQNDGKLLIIDEAQGIEIEHWTNLSEGRTEGLLKVSGIKTGEAPCRTRLIMLANPAKNKFVGEFLHGAEVFKELFRDADLRRSDFADVLSKSDQDPGVVDKLEDEREAIPQKVLPSTLHNSVAWAWSRKPGQIQFTKPAARQVIESVKTLKGEYGAAIDIPLLAADAKHKIARLSVATAALVHSTDESHENIVVRNEHVKFVEDYLKSIYSHNSFALGRYAKLTGSADEVIEEEYQNLVSIIARDSDIREIAKHFLTNDRMQRAELAAIVMTSDSTISGKIRIFKDMRLVVSRSGSRNGYMRTRKFIKYLKRLEESGQLSL